MFPKSNHLSQSQPAGCPPFFVVETADEKTGRLTRLANYTKRVID
jgi:hypothetical protein